MIVIDGVDEWCVDTCVKSATAITTIIRFESGEVFIDVDDDALETEKSQRLPRGTLAACDETDAE